jgi:hypothetical protein
MSIGEAIHIVAVITGGIVVLVTPGLFAARLLSKVRPATEKRTKWLTFAGVEIGVVAVFGAFFSSTMLVKGSHIFERARQETPTPSVDEVHGFPWPPPRPFQALVYDTSDWSRPCNQRVVRVNDALTRIGYQTRFLYLVDGQGELHEGIALLTGLEAIDRAGHSLEPHSVASLNAAEVRLRTIQGLSRFFGPPNHRERMFVFILTPEYFGAQYGPPIASSDAARFFDGGIVQPPTRQIEKMCRSDWLVTVLVYEFDADAQGERRVVDNDAALGVHIHLAGAGIHP